MSIIKGKFKVTSRYLKNRTIDGKTSLHRGIDIVSENKNIYAGVDGKVANAGWENIGNKKQGFGLYVKIIYKGDRIYYGHLDKVLVKEGDIVTPDTLIGIIGNTGHSFGTHLHFEYRKGEAGGERLNPATFLGIPNIEGWYEFKEEVEIMNEVSEWAKKGQEFVIKNNISDGTRPKDNVTREELWTMLEKLFNLTEQKKLDYVNEVVKIFKDKIDKVFE